MNAAGLLLARSWKPIVAGAANYDGSTYLHRGAGLTGAVDSKTGILSFWARWAATPGTQYTVFGTAGGFQALITTGDLINLLGNNPSATPILSMHSNATLSHNAWHHFLLAWDLAAGVGGAHIYVDDVSDKSVNVFTNDVLDYTVADWGLGAFDTGGSKCAADLAEFYFAPGQFLDFSVTANRRKFITATLVPYNLGSDGSLPTGTAPIMYHALPVGGTPSGFATNKGTGGNFTTGAGALLAASTSPSR